MEDLVSIITPSYNTGRWIAETIESVLHQTYQNWEMIIVDDCSSDNTDDVIAGYTDKRIKYLKNSLTFKIRSAIFLIIHKQCQQFVGAVLCCYRGI